MAKCKTKNNLEPCSAPPLIPMEQIVAKLGDHISEKKKAFLMMHKDMPGIYLASMEAYEYHNSDRFIGYKVIFRYGIPGCEGELILDTRF